MMKVISALMLWAMQTASAQKFDCPQGTVCTEFSDGCNTCTAPDGNAALAACTAMACDCLNDNSCETTCLDNEECVWIEESNPGLFECPEGTVCREFTDGCNSCTAPDGDTAMAGCTEMWCSCYEDNSCVPQCTDNELCVPVGSAAAANAPTCTVDSDCPVINCFVAPCDTNVCNNGVCELQPNGDNLIPGGGAGDRTEMSRQECTDEYNGIVVGDIGNGAIHSPDYICESNGQAPIGTVIPGEGEPIASEGEVCCGADEDMGVVGETTDSCTPSDETVCPVADCASPQDTDCQYQQGDYMLNFEGNCCREQCVFVHSNGERCTFGEDTTVVGETTDSCKPSDETVCPVVDCASPPDTDCQYQQGDYMLNFEGNCCREQCVFVHSNGERCTFGEDTTVSVTNTAEDTGTCTPSKDVPCPVAGCLPPSDPDCQYQEGDYFLDSAGNCCREQCVFVHSNGERCELEEEATAEDGKVTDSAATATEEVACTPRGDESCPTAKCAAPPTGCQYKHDHYVLFSNGVCCPSMCYAVDSEGNECPFEPSGEDHGEDHDHNLQPGDMCTPHNDSGAATATTKQATEPEAEKCPVAGCAAAPEGCEYKMDHYVINAVGDCCPELCYAVDSDGNECVGSGSSESSSSKHSLWLGSSLIAAAVFLLAKN